MDGSIWILLVAPAVLGLGALVAGILLLTRGPVSEEDAERARGATLALRIAAGFCFLIAFGIGSCYAVMFMG